MWNKWKKIFILSLCCIGVGSLGYLYFAGHQSFVLIKNDETPAFVKKVVHKLNQSQPFKDKKYRIYTAGFGVFDKIPKLAEHKQEAVLWLGNNDLTDLDNISDYGLVLVNSFSSLIYLDKNGIKAYLEPIGYVEADAFNIFTGDEWAVIGNPPFVADALKTKRIPFKEYSWGEIIKNPSLIRDVKAVAAEDPFLSTGSTDLPPILLNLAAAGVPILAEWKGEHTPSLLHLFNDNINFYLYENNAADMVDEINLMSDKVKERSEHNKEFVKRYFSIESAADNIRSILLNGKERTPNYEKNALSISLRTKVGHYGAGEYWLAQDIKEYFKKENYDGHIIFENSFYDEPSEITLKLRGPVFLKDAVKKDNMTVLWQIYPEGKEETKEKYLQDMITAMQGSDIFISAAKDIALRMKEMGYKAYYLPQFTNTSRFYPDVDENLKSEVIFVGNYHFKRKGVVWAVKQGVPITIYGDKYPEGMAKDKYIDNRILRKYYSSAKIVLNDTKPLMRKLGFISNRIFDATACGSLVISDYMKEIEEIYGDSIPMYKTPEELAFLVRYYLSHDEERVRLAKKAQEITLQNFSADKVLGQLYDIIRQTKKDLEQ